MDQKKYYLTEDQVTGLIKLINEEIDANILAQNDAYNGYWETIKMRLGYAITR